VNPKAKLRLLVALVVAIVVLPAHFFLGRFVVNTVWRTGTEIVPSGNQVTSATAEARLAEAKGLLRNAERVEEKWRQARDLADAWRRAEKAWEEALRLAQEWEEVGER
jgi:hypothetical protein